MDVKFKVRRMGLVSLYWILFWAGLWDFLLEPLQPLLHRVFLLGRVSSLLSSEGEGALGLLFDLLLE